MNEDLAKLIIATGAGVGVVVWLVALWLYRRMADTPAAETIEAAIRDKSPAEAIKAVVAWMALPQGGPVTLSRPSELVFEITQLHCHARIEAYRAGGQTMLAAEFDDTKLRRRMQRWLALNIVVVIPIAIVAIGYWLWYYAAASAAPGVRTQAVQIVQLVHVLWPPFLFYGLWKNQRRTARDTVANLLVLAQG
jgi:hypothetical protein